MKLQVLDVGTVIRTIERRKDIDIQDEPQVMVDFVTSIGNINMEARKLAGCCNKHSNRTVWPIEQKPGKKVDED